MTIEDDDAWIPTAGTLIAGRYRVVSLIGKGGMGAVVSADHVALGNRVAVKFLHPKLTSSSDVRERFTREAKASARISSPHVVRALDVGATESGLPFIAMELLEGEDLAHTLLRGPLRVELACDCVLQAAEALAEAHASGIVHRDIKPSNLWCTTQRDGSPFVKVLDFGISRLLVTEGNDARLTHTTATFGSPSYMSPEQIRSVKSADAAADIWALGVALFELLTGALPFAGESTAGVLASIVADAPKPLGALRPDVPEPVAAAIVRCLEKDPARRASLVELASMLRPFASIVGQLSADRVADSRGRVVVRPSTAPAARSTPELHDAATVMSEPAEGELASFRKAAARWRAPRTKLLALMAAAVALALAAAGVVLRRPRETSRVPTPSPSTAVSASEQPSAIADARAPSRAAATTEDAFASARVGDRASGDAGARDAGVALAAEPTPSSDEPRGRRKPPSGTASSPLALPTSNTRE